MNEKEGMEIIKRGLQKVRSLYVKPPSPPLLTLVVETKAKPVNAPDPDKELALALGGFLPDDQAVRVLKEALIKQNVTPNASPELFGLLVSTTTSATKDLVRIHEALGFARDTPPEVDAMVTEIQKLQEPEMEFIDALRISKRVLDVYKFEQYKWWSRMNDTPILNDIAVRMAHAYMEARRVKP